MVRPASVNGVVSRVERGVAIAMVAKVERMMVERRYILGF